MREYDTRSEPIRRRRRRFDDDSEIAPSRGRRAQAELSTLDGRAGTDLDGPPTGDRWSTWDGAVHGPKPRPRWVITEHGAVDTELGVLKTGKEADVHLIERVGARHRPAHPAGGQALPHRRAPDVPPRRRLPGGTAGAPVPGDAGDGQPHRLRPRPAVRAVGAGRVRRAGRALVGRGGGALSRCSWSAPSCCWSSSATPDGRAAPRLAQLRPDPDELRELWRQLTEALLGLAGQGLTHGDLSAYNLLVHDGRLVLIDLPQVVDVVGNPQGPQFLARDVQRIADWFAARGLPPEVGTADTLLGELRITLGMRGGRRTSHP